MRGEYILTAEDLRTRFQGERDLITYSPYRVGDRVVRCGSCGRVIKAEFVAGNTCPLCSASFRAIPVIPRQAAPVRAARTRSLKTYLWLLILFAVLSFLPYASPEACYDLQELGFGASLEAMLIYNGTAAGIAALLLYRNQTCRTAWRSKPAGWLLALLPGFAPVGLLLAARPLIAILEVLAGIFLAFVVIAFLIGILSS